MNDMNDQVIEAIQAYAATLPNPELKLNLLAIAEHMAPELTKALGLQQEWGLVTVEVNPGRPESIDRVRYESDTATLPFNELEWRREQADKYDDHPEYTRDYVGTRLFTEWAEVHPIILNEDEQKQMDIDQAPIPG